MFTSTWMFALAVTYTVVFNLLLLPAAFMIIHALLNLQVICFRSLGKEYLCCLLVTGLLLHFISIGAVWHLALVPDEARVIVVNGSLTGVRLMISGVMYGVLCSRQFVLARIFGRLKGGGRIHTSSWRFLIFAVVAWVPLMVLFYVSLFLDFSVEYFGAFVFLYYFIYTAAFAYLCHKNKGINKIFSDYYRNIMTVVSIVALLLVTLWVTIQYQIVSVQTYVFEVAMCSVLEPCRLCVFSSPPRPPTSCGAQIRTRSRTGRNSTRPPRSTAPRRASKLWTGRKKNERPNVRGERNEHIFASFLQL